MQSCFKVQVNKQVWWTSGWPIQMKRMVKELFILRPIYYYFMIEDGDVANNMSQFICLVDNFPNAKRLTRLVCSLIDCTEENGCRSFYLILFLSVWIDVSLSVVSIFDGIGNRLFLSELLSFFGPQLPDDSKHLIGEIRSDRRSGLLSLDDKLNEFGFALAIHVQWEPVVEVLGTDPPAMRDSFGGMEDKVVDITEEDGLGGGERKVVLIDDYKLIVDGNLAVLVYWLHSLRDSALQKYGDFIIECWIYVLLANRLQHHFSRYFFFAFLKKQFLSFLYIYKSAMSTRVFFLITTLLFLLTLVAPHAVQQIQNPEIQVITAYLNQAKSINIPFQKCFKAEPELDANLQYLDFSPTRIGLSTLKSFPIKNQGSHISAFEQLRSPNSFKHRNLLVFENYLMVFFAPNIIFILEQSRQGFKLKNKYFLQNLERFDQFKMYKLEDKALLVIFNKNRAYLLNQIDYEDYTFAEISSIVHLQETGKDSEFYAAESLKGLSHYRLNSTTKKIDLVKRYNGDTVGLKGRFNYIVDINLRLLPIKGIIYALDAEIGLVEIEIANAQKSKILVSHKNCESFDTIGEEHFVLLCQSQGHSTIIEAYRYVDKKTKEFKYRKIQPIFQANYLNDLHLTEKYYLVYSYKSIHAFWNTQKNRLPETLETQSQIAVPGLQTFTLHNSNGLNFLYTIQAGELKKYELRQQKPKLLLKAYTPVDKLFKIYMYGSCNDLAQQPEEGNVKACKVSKTISFKAIQQQYPHEQDVNISASIVIILITAFLLLIWVCLKKYKGMQRQARKILENYQKKRKNQHRAI